MNYTRQLQEEINGIAAKLSNEELKTLANRMSEDLKRIQ